MLLENKNAVIYGGASWYEKKARLQRIGVAIFYVNDSKMKGPSLCVE